MTDRIHNFSAGPAVLPEPVLRKAQEAIWNIAGSGIGIMEHSHRGKVFERILDETEAACRALAGIPDDYVVLFLQGGASLQFSMVPMNLLPDDRTGDYLLTGVWAQKAVKEAKILGRKVHLAASSEATGFDRIPKAGEIAYSANPAYVHLTTNNTIYGTQWASEPAVPAGVPLVADTSSDMYSRPIDVSKYGLIYAGAQKNLGPAGVVLAIVRKDMYARQKKTASKLWSFKDQAEAKSMVNTPPTFGIYILLEVFRWLEAQGGLAAMEKRNATKAGMIYDAIDQSNGFYKGTVSVKEQRSHMNVTYRLPSDELTDEFIKTCSKNQMVGLKGYRTVGGIRASIYNAMPVEGCQALASFMKDFASKKS
jgi:phosphoserine aminotransferase